MSVSIGMVVMVAGMISISFDYYGRHDRDAFNYEIQETIGEKQPCAERKWRTAKSIAAARMRSEAAEKRGAPPDPIDDAIRWNAEDRAEGNALTTPSRYCAPGYDPPWPPGG